MAIASGPSQISSRDFMPDALEDGLRFRVRSIINDLGQDRLATAVDTNVAGVRVSRELDRVADPSTDQPHVSGSI
ncbi:hypothetical protein [Cognatishimia sp. F0-27]|uniref:hypothetical protein n=1 Tax=Cognatishimia sp. F0-27 TaxID=2816855 RepID=UPI001D0CDACD|nr:hypothetical protein [Cognatishimia sp. F0-27]